MNDVKRLSDTKVVQKTVELRSREKEILHELLVYIGEMDERRLYREEGYSSMFVYLRSHLGYSDGGACRRIKVARCVRRYPQMLRALKEGELTLSTACELSQAGDRENFLELLEQSLGKTVDQISALIAVPSKRKRKESVRRVAIKRVPTVETPVDPLFSTVESPEPTVKMTVAEAPQREVGYSLTMYNLSMEVDEEFMSLYREVKGLTGGRSMKEVFQKVLGEYSKKHSPKEREKRRRQRRAQEPTPSKRTRHIPVALRDKVHLRDSGRCTYTSKTGVRCEATECLELDHIVPFSCGGEHSMENLRLRCKAHNLLAAEEAFGKEFMEMRRGKTVVPLRN